MNNSLIISLFPSDTQNREVGISIAEAGDHI
jgi:hypothetical protein